MGLARRSTGGDASMIDGFYSFYLTGRHGSSFGILALHDGVIAGTDVAGVAYDGGYTEDQTAQSLDVELMIYAPAGTRPVQTGETLTAPFSMPAKFLLPRGRINTSEPTLITTRLGPMNAIFRKIRDYPGVEDRRSTALAAA